MGELRTYDLSKLIVSITGTLGGARIGPGWADGDAIAVEWTSDIFTEQGGSQGEWARSASNDRSGLIRIMLMQTGQSNDVLDGYRLLSERVGVGDLFTFTATDLGGRTVIIAEKCYVKTRPGLTFGREAQSREWVCFSPDINAKIGGNA